MNIDIREILEIMPHRYPFLLVDRILECEKGKRVVGIKNVTIGEPYFQGHFPGNPVMPGVLIVEAMAQATGLLAMESNPETVSETSIYLFVGIDKADIVEAELKKKTAQVTVKFVSELITATRDKAGKVIDGDPKKVREVTDIWTFARDVSSRDPNWKLVATEAGMPSSRRRAPAAPPRPAQRPFPGVSAGGPTGYLPDRPGHPGRSAARCRRPRARPPRR